MQTVHPPALFVNQIVQAISRRRDRCEATVLTADGFVRRAITPEQYQAIAHCLSRFEVASGPTNMTFNVLAQKEMVEQC